MDGDLDLSTLLHHAVDGDLDLSTLLHHAVQPHREDKSKTGRHWVHDLLINKHKADNSVKCGFNQRAYIIYSIARGVIFYFVIGDALCFRRGDTSIAGEGVHDCLASVSLVPGPQSGPPGKCAWDSMCRLH